ncbi:hypothetical protein [uncultured Methanobrevibacter sp.]|uniref:hypothetical protein n=1 Tax=uncultured Methanobrevibacter sp. TaxID=253161 RepID=UPI0025F29E35|nr:hypothetical protein [uncultured Methanobrevibacter sp.]
MNNLFILTEERAKNDVVEQILELYSKEYGKKANFNDVNIIPEIKNNKHTFQYKVEGAEIEGIDRIALLIVSGYSSFVDFLLFEQEDKPDNRNDNLLMLIEETKTSDKESRNTGVYQRSSKFVYSDYYYPDVPKYMLYNSENSDHNKAPTDTSVFGTNLLLTQNVTIIGKDLHYFRKFESIEDLARTKNRMRRPPKGNVPIDITIKDDRIEVSGRLSKPANEGNIGHDPNIGSLTSIAKTLRVLGWNGRIVITQHGVKQEKVNRMRSNKFLNIASILDVELDGIRFRKPRLPTQYWKYEENSEKLGTIFLHLLAIGLDEDIKGIYENHAGCERGYFYTKRNTTVTIPKKDKKGVNLYIPDLILRNDKYKEILLIEGKQSSTLDRGLEEIEYFDSIEDEIITPNYRDYSIRRWVVTYGRDIYHNNLNPKVLFHLNKDGSYYVNDNAPSWIKDLLHDN